MSEGRIVYQVCIYLCVSYQWVRWKESSGDSVQVGKRELNGGVGESELVQIGGAHVPWADVTFS